MKDKLILVSIPFVNRDSIYDRLMNDSNFRVYYVPNKDGIFRELENQDPVQFKREMLGIPWTDPDKNHDSRIMKTETKKDNPTE